MNKMIATSMLSACMTFTCQAEKIDCRASVPVSYPPVLKAEFYGPGYDIIMGVRDVSTKTEITIMKEGKPTAIDSTPYDEEISWDILIGLKGGWGFHARTEMLCKKNVCTHNNGDTWGGRVIEMTATSWRTLLGATADFYTWSIDPRILYTSNRVELDIPDDFNQNYSVSSYQANVRFIMTYNNSDTSYPGYPSGPGQFVAETVLDCETRAIPLSISTTPLVIDYGNITVGTTNHTQPLNFTITSRPGGPVPTGTFNFTSTTADSATGGINLGEGIVTVQQVADNKIIKTGEIHSISDKSMDFMLSLDATRALNGAHTGTLTINMTVD